jgi:ubiquinone/menaquinone biosynthesis C-methylase UbiE
MTDFNEIKKEYDRVAEYYHKSITNPATSFWNTYIERPAMTKVLKNRVKGKKVLDIGCGTGIQTEMLKTWGAEVVGSDLSEGQVGIARREYPDIEFFVENAINTHFKDEEFDLVAASMMVNYFEDLRPLFTEVFRVLKTGGQFVFSGQHPFKEYLRKEKTKDGYRFYLDAYYRTEPYLCEIFDIHLTHYRHTIQTIFDALLDAGFRVEQVFEPQPVPESEKLDPPNFKKCSNLPTIIVFVVKKS